MKTTLYRGFRFPKAIIQHAIWLYLRFALSYPARHRRHHSSSERGPV